MTGPSPDRRPLLVVLRALGLGDYLTGVPALRALADAFPAHRRVLAAPAWLGPLVAHTGAVDALAPTPGLVPLAADLRHPDVAVDLHGRGPGSQPLLVEVAPRRLVAFAHSAIPETAGHPIWRPDEHEVHRWCRLLQESGIPADPGRLDLSPPPLPVTGPCAGRAGATVIHPGAASEARRWPVERFAAVARHEQSEGRQVVVTGSRTETGRARRLADLAGLPDDVVVAGRTDVLDLLALVGAAGRVVSGDTGVAHVATAVGTPSVVLFGPIPPAEWGPPPDRPWHRALWAGRRGDPHGDTVDPGLLELSVADVIDALSRLPTAPPRPGAVPV
ncbi:MAG TPA: glycosyltransferase family 9 protein [Acidimicrobiales bacterium]|nr:glycosyltransferase family 9 protein [Acidimicrobiales bacterium]